jgi:aerobic carbon-monoxide dehydrogenase large subunit
MSILGHRVQRVEDPQFLTVGGRYVNDLDDEPLLRGARWVHYVRSSAAHARISVSCDAARMAPGVVAVLSAADIDLGTVPPDAPVFPKTVTRPWLAHDVVRYVGEPIAAVVANTLAEAIDAGTLVEVDYELLDPVVDVVDSLQDEVLVHPGHGSNVVMGIEATGDATEADFEACEVVVEFTMLNQRIAPCPIEPRAAAAHWVHPALLDATHAESGALASHPNTMLHYWCTSQGIHPIRNLVSRIYGLEPKTVRGVTPHVGGGFGAKAMPYPEELLLPFLSHATGGPVRWTSGRSDDMVNLAHGRAQLQRIRLGGTKDGYLRAYHLDVIADSGAYPRYGAYLPNMTKLMQTGCYEIPKQLFSSQSVLTHTTPVGPYRGAGRPEAAAAIERAIDRFAHAIHMDPTEVRRRNALTPDRFPHTTKSGASYDSGNYVGALEQALSISGYTELRSEQALRRSNGSRMALGIGVGLYVEVTALNDGGEYSRVDVLRDGRVRALTGTSPHGQGHATTWAMLISEQLGVPMASIDVVFGDTDIVPSGEITGGSRSLQTGGVSMFRAAAEVARKAKELAADLLEASPDDVVIDSERSMFHVAGVPSSGVSWAKVVSTAYLTGDLSDHGDDQATGETSAQSAESWVSIEPLGPLGVEHRWGAGKPTFPSGAHVAVVEVDVDTGKVFLRRMIAVDDAGRIINPLLAEGQVHGGLAQGIAQALLEEFVYDTDGNPLTSTFADYSVISAAELPSFELGHFVTMSPVNELGVKGIGESGTVGAGPAVHNAVVDALSHLGVTHIDMPLTPMRVWTALQNV